MLGYFETEVNSLKPALGMWGNAGFSSLSSTLGADFGSGESSRMRSSNASSVELERLIMGDLFPVSHDFDDLQHHLDSFSSPVLSLPPPTLLSTTLSNNNIVTGDKNGLMDNADTNSGAPQYIFPGPVASCIENQVRIGEVVVANGESSLGLRASKRPKMTTQGDRKPTSARKQLIKAPVKRSQKLGNKITALQQLVSPFGKTDTASVLHEAAVCINVLHRKIQMLTAAPLIGINSSACQQAGRGGERDDLLSRGFCLLPISSTIFNLADQVTLDRDESTARRDNFYY